MTKISKFPDNHTIENTVSNLQKNGFEVLVVDSIKEAQQTVSDLIPPKNQVLTMSSVTLEQTDIFRQINESGLYDSIHRRAVKLDILGKEYERKSLIATPRVAVGSVNAITQKGQLFFASNSGSQIPAYSYTSEKVILIVGVNKIIPDINSALDRIYQHVLPLEKKRLTPSPVEVNKIYIQNREPISGRTTIILVRQQLGY